MIHTKSSNSISPNIKLAVIGLGYVGLPLSIEFAKKYDVVGFDTKVSRVMELKNGEDRTHEADLYDLKDVISKKTESADSGLTLSDNPNELKECNVFIITVPTPIDEFNAPDLSSLLEASRIVGSVLKKGDIVIYESTVYPGCTEEDIEEIYKEMN